MDSTLSRFDETFEKEALCKRGLNTVTTASFKIIYVGSFYIYFIMLLVLYGGIFYTARRHIRQIHVVNKNDADDKAKWRKMKADLKIAKMLGWVFGVFYLSYIPATATVAVTWMIGATGDEVHIRIIRNVTSRIIYFNSVANPIAYAWKDRTFRSAFISLLRCRPLPPPAEFEKSVD